MKGRFSSIASSVVFLGLAFVAGSYYGREIKSPLELAPNLSGHETGQPPVDFSVFWEAWHTLDSRYVPVAKGGATSTNKAASEKERVWGAIAGLTRSLGDPYTVYFPPEQAKIFESDISGQFEGVGMEIGIREGVLSVVAPLKGTPAFRAGILSGDKILEINGEKTDGLPVDQAVSKIRGKKGSTVALLIERKSLEKPITIAVVRDVIVVPTISTEPSSTIAQDGKKVDKDNDGLRDDGIYVIRLFNFGATSPDQFRETVQKFVATGNTKMILDLRGNPGGYLEAAVAIASWFLPEGKVVVREIYGGDKPDDEYTSFGYDVIGPNTKVAVLVDQGSASASEILAGALHEHGRATLIGQKTYGKGSVQELIHLNDQSSLKVTIARWFTPNGHSINESGLEPDIVVPIMPEDIKAGRDPQFARAVEFLNTGK